MTDEFCWPPSTITKVQRAALEKLADGDFHSLASFATNTRISLYERGLVEDRGPRGIITRNYPRHPNGRESGSVGSPRLDYRITEAGRMFIRETV